MPTEHPSSILLRAALHLYANYSSDETHHTAPLVVTSLGLFNSVCSRIGECFELDERAFDLVTRADTIEWAQVVELDVPTESVFARVADRYAQLQRIGLRSYYGDTAPVNLMLSRMNSRWLLELDLGGCGCLEDATCEQLGAPDCCQLLEVLALDDLHNVVTDSGISHLRRKRFRQLTLHQLKHVTDAGLTACLESSGGRLEKLVLRRLNITGAALRHLQRTCGGSLQVLEMANCPIADDTFALVPDNNTVGFAALETVSLASCASFVAPDLAALWWHISHLNEWFLSACQGITAIDLTPMTNIKTIGAGLLNECSNITTLKLPPLASDFTDLGSYFLCGCESLATVDLSPLAKIETIGANFLSSCSALTAVDLAPLNNVTTVGFGFLSYCTGLTTIDVAPLHRLTSVDRLFLFRCTRLTTIDLSPLHRVTSVADRFLAECSGLTAIDLSPLGNLTKVGGRFLSGCRGLSVLDVSPLKHVTSIDVGFLEDCTGLSTTLDLSMLTAIESVGNAQQQEDRFLEGCSSLQSVRLSDALLDWVDLPDKWKK